MKRLFTFLFAFSLFITLGSAQAPSIPITFESSTIMYTWADFAGGVASVVNNPDKSGINTSDRVGQMVKFNGEPFGGSTLALAGPVDFGNNNAIRMKVWSNRVGARVLFKFEGMTPAEVQATTTVANEWEELTFSFAGLTGLSFTAITIIYDLGVVGDGSANFTLYFDDIFLTTATGGIQLPIDFESMELNYAFENFGGGVGEVIDNPEVSGINTSANVARITKFSGEVFGGVKLNLGSPIDFGENNAIKMKVFANRVDAPVLFKLEGPNQAEVTARTTVADEWHELTFNFAGLTDGIYTAVTIIYDLGVVGDGGADFTLLVDDIQLTQVTGNTIQIPITFEAEELNYTFSNFGGGVATIIDNPQPNGINTSDKVVQMVKFAGEVFGGSTLALGGALSFGDQTMISMKVFSNRVGAPVLFKLEGPMPVERTQNTTVANEWEILTFDFSGFTDGTYTGITIIYDLGVVGDGSDDFTLLFDDIEFGTGVSVTDLTALQATYYPNPAHDYLTLSAAEVMETLVIYNMSGQQVYRAVLNSHQQTIDVAALPVGNYIIRVKIGDQYGIGRLIKQ